MSSKFTRRSILGAGAVLASVPLVGRSAKAQAWKPTKPVRVICAYPAGGGSDALARAFADYLSKQLGQPFTVENKAGASGSVAALDVRRAPPDGYTLMYTISTTMILNKVLYKNLQYDTDKDFDLISYVPVPGLPLMASTATGAKTLQEFVAFARKEKANVGTYAAGSFAHLCIAELNKAFDLKIEAVHYRGEAPMWTDLAAGSIHGGIGGAVPALNLVDTGKARPVAMLSKKRLKKMPDVPTFLEQGLTASFFGLSGYTCMVAPAGLPEEIAETYSKLCVAAGSDPTTWQRMEAAGAEDPPTSRQEFARLQREEAQVWRAAASSLGVQLDQ
jgi:tripartite-type tricarboxylate transporter receptor subunit TctC